MTTTQAAQPTAEQSPGWYSVTMRVTEVVDRTYAFRARSVDDAREWLEEHDVFSDGVELGDGMGELIDNGEYEQVAAPVHMDIPGLRSSEPTAPELEPAITSALRAALDAELDGYSLASRLALTGCDVQLTTLLCNAARMIDPAGQVSTGRLLRTMAGMEPPAVSRAAALEVRVARLRQEIALAP